MPPAGVKRPVTVDGLDLSSMPGLDGIGVLRALRHTGRSEKMPVIVVSAFSPSQGARAVDALAEGAFDLVAKPAIGEGLEGFAQALVTQGPRPSATGEGRRSRALSGSFVRQPRRQVRSNVARAVVIATSTGGPKALAALMPKLPAPLGVGTLIVQHMPPGFTKSLAARLNQASGLDIREADGGETLQSSGRVAGTRRQAHACGHRGSREPDR